MKITRKYIEGLTNNRRKLLVDWIRLKVSFEALLRILADIILINLAIVSSLVILLLLAPGDCLPGGRDQLPPDFL